MRMIAVTCLLLFASPALASGFTLEFAGGVGTLLRPERAPVFSIAGTGGGAGYWITPSTTLSLRFTTTSWYGKNPIMAVEDDSSQDGSSEPAADPMPYVGRQQFGLAVYSLHFLTPDWFVGGGVGIAATGVLSRFAEMGVQRARPEPERRTGLLLGLRAGRVLHVTKTGSMLTLSLDAQPTLYAGRGAISPIALLLGFQIP